VSHWEYRKIALNEVPRLRDDIDVLCEAGLDGWELVAILPNNVAYLKRRVATAPGAEERTKDAVPDVTADVAEDDSRSRTLEKSHEANPKYRDPQTNDTWSGRGRMPNWLKRKQEAGEDIEEYLV
jgi:DNA-binding protein H-NS